MSPVTVIAVFDIGKTNKKFFLVDEQYRIVYERSTRLEEITDEDGDACEDVVQLSAWARQIFSEAIALPGYSIAALNFSAYGASLVHIDDEGDPVTPLYNYLKAYPSSLQEELYGRYGGETVFSVTTVSPALGSLNAGLQLYRLKYQKQKEFNRINCSLHLPQYMSWLFTGKAYSDITSIGCHTALWDFKNNQYHSWVSEEGILPKLAPVFPGNMVIDIVYKGSMLKCGIGLHDSSAALIPYLAVFREPFVLISTGTWSISLNPFNGTELTAEELKQDCLCYLGCEGRPVKASRLFAGNLHEKGVQRIAAYFNADTDQYKEVQFDKSIADKIERLPVDEDFSEQDLSLLDNYAEAYHALVISIMRQQQRSTALVLDEKTRRIFVDGGFAGNSIYMHLLAKAFPRCEVFAASVSQAAAIGAALAIHAHWNAKPVPADMVSMRYYHSP